MNPLLLDMVAAQGTTTSSALTTKIGRNMKMIANTFDNNDHCVSIATKFPTTTSETIIHALNCIWLNKGLDENTHSMNKHLTVLNLHGPPSNPTEHLHYSSMNRSLATAHRECELNQKVLHSKPKTLDLRGQVFESRNLEKLKNSKSIKK